MAQWLKRRTWAQRIWVHLPLVPIWVIGGGGKGIRPKLLPWASKSATSVGSSMPFSKAVSDVEFGRNSDDLSPPRFNGHFPAKDDGGGGDNWSYKSCKAPVKSSPPTNQHRFFTGQMPFLSPNQQCQSTEGKISHSMDLLTPSSPGVFQLYLWPLIAPGYLGGGLPCLSSALWRQ